ncbi:hypothetical protein CSOJ01_05260 [Colletotrichum sojae]|uniref:F-box domain-containing protein n=1 Tax=Colletotrichum sojae TaxID=2175907 RepID=A0A8H6JGP1_9PEZI|nr:hypothetical protein CSOJ01_05260 [Colletotrichum sojae]
MGRETRVEKPSSGFFSKLMQRVLPSGLSQKRNTQTRELQPGIQNRTADILNLDGVPTEILLSILDHLGPAERAAMALCNKTMLIKLGRASLDIPQQSAALRQLLLGLERDDRDRLQAMGGRCFRTMPLFCGRCVLLHPPELSWLMPADPNGRDQVNAVARRPCSRHPHMRQNTHGIPSFLHLYTTMALHQTTRDTRKTDAAVKSLDYITAAFIPLQRYPSAFISAEYRSSHAVEKNKIIRRSLLDIKPDDSARNLPLYPSDLLDALAHHPFYRQCCAHVSWQRAFPDLFNDGPHEDSTPEDFNNGTWFQRMLLGHWSPEFTCKACRTIYLYRIKHNGRLLRLIAIKNLGSCKDERDPKWLSHQLPKFGAADDRLYLSVTAAKNWARYGWGRVSRKLGIN